MKKLLVVSLVLSFILISFTAVALANANYPLKDGDGGYIYDNPVETEYAPGRFMVKLTEMAYESPAFKIEKNRGALTTGIASLDLKNAQNNVIDMKRAHIDVADKQMDEELGISRWHMVYVPETTDVKALAAEYAADPNVEVAQVDYRAFPMLVPNDTYYSEQWGHKNTGQMNSYSGGDVGTPGFDGNVEPAWDALGGYGSSSIIIGIIDSGVDVDHPDLNLVAGYDFGDNDSNPDDNSAEPGHGTACAGVAAAKANNGIGVAGVAGGCKVMPLKVANNQGGMYFSSIQNALYHAADNGAHIGSMSLGAAIDSDSATDTALQYAYNAGVTLLAATGNENASTVSYPACNQYVIAVGAANPCDGRKRSSSSSTQVNPGVNTDPNGTSCDGQTWWGSNYGVTTANDRRAVDIIAPTILPATDIGGSGGYASGDYSMDFNGTSCATPFAAGVAALVKSANPGFTPAQVRTAIVNAADDVVNVEAGAGWDRYTGYGMINAGAALGGNMAPSANANGPYSANPGVAISFSSAGSSDLDGSIVSYHWAFGDGATSTQANPSHAYAVEGFYTATLTVTDNEGATGVADANVTIGNPCSGVQAADGDIALNLVTDRYGSETSWTLKNSSGTTINSGSGYGNSTTYNINLGPLSEGQYTFTINDSYGDGICCSYGSGSYTLKDGANNTLATGGAFGSSEATVFCVPGGTPPANNPPIAEANGPYSAYEGVAISFSSSGSSDSDGSIVSFSWNFGDGATSTQANPSHAYASAGNYTATLTVTDDDGDSDNDTATVTISVQPSNQAPVAEANGPYTGTEDIAISFSSAGSADPDGSISSYSWNFGDGGTSTAANPTHVYADPGNYTVTLTVTDNDGATDNDTAAVTVDAAPIGGDEILVQSDFESGWDVWIDGGTDCLRYTSGTRAYSGSAAINIQDNSGTKSSFYTNQDFNVSSFASIEIDFYFYAYSMETGEDFWVQFYNGSSWQTVASYARGTNFDNNTFYHATVTLNEANYNFPTNAEFRFMCDASGNADDVYIDLVTITGLATGGASTMNGLISLGLVDDLGAMLPTLHQNFPNPFNPATTISYTLAKDANVSLNIYNVNGQLVRTLVNQHQGVGTHNAVWDGRNDHGLDVSSGTYFYQINADGHSEMMKMNLLK